MEDLASKNCVPCSGEVSPLVANKKDELKKKLHPDWQLVADGKKLRRSLFFKDFATPLKLLVQLGDLCESEGHHADFYLSYGKLQIEIWTHKINDLVETDFIWALKADTLISR